MSELILSWLNDEVQLSKKITNFESDFSNGYFFGELLSKYNQQLNFKSFINKSLRSSKIENFKMLEPTFKILKIKFDSNIVEKIIKEEKGVSLTLLYQLKMALEKVNNPADYILFSKTKRYNTINPLKKIEPAIEQYDNMTSNFFGRRLNEMNKAQKEVNLDNHLKKFEQRKLKQDEELRKLREEDEVNEKRIKDEMRKIQLNKLQRNIAFMEDWKQKGEENWEKNQKILKEREKRDKEFVEKVNEKKAVRGKTLQKLNEDDLVDGIKLFEKRLEVFRQDNAYPELEKRPSSMPLEKSMFSTTGTISRLKEKRMLTDFLRKERDKRRRKMIVEQAKSQREIEVRKREELLVDKLKQLSRQEKELEYEIWRAEECKKIIQGNRLIREKNYKQKREVIVLCSKHREEEMMNILKEERQKDLEVKKIRQKELEIGYKQDNRKSNYHLCDELIDSIFEIADVFYSHQQNDDRFNIDSRLFNEITKLFIEGEPLIPVKKFRNIRGVEGLKLESHNTEIAKAFDVVSVNELENYLSKAGQWSYDGKIELVLENGEIEADIMDRVKTNNNIFLGNIVKFVINNFYKNQADERLGPSINEFLGITISVVGYDFSGKKTITNFLKQKYGLEILRLENIINECFERIESVDYAKSKLENNISPKARNLIHQMNSVEEALRIVPGEEKFLEIGRKIKQYAVRGLKIPDELYVELIGEKINMLFPKKTKEEFIEFYENLPEQIVSNSMMMGSNAMDFNSMAPLTSEELIMKKIMNHNHKYHDGWVLIDFPHTYEQAKKLEKYISGFVTQDEQKKSEREIKIQQASMLVQSDPVQIIPRKLKKGGIDMVFNLCLPKEECLRRALGRKIDSLNKVVYHLDDAVPPTDNAPLMERLENLRDIQDNELMIVNHNVAYDQNLEGLKSWYSNFGFEVEGLNTLLNIRSDVNIENLLLKVNDYTEKILKMKADLYSGYIQEKFDEINKIKMKEEEARLHKEREDKMESYPAEEIESDLKMIGSRGRDNLSDELKVYLFKLWENIYHTYMSECKHVFLGIRDQREFIIIRLADLQRKFIELIRRQDEKPFHVLKYQKEYNEFCDKNPDMIEEQQTKEELHQRVDDLCETLTEIIDHKKELLLDERKQIMESMWIENEMEYFLLEIQRFVQAELDKTFRSIQLMSDYYGGLDQKESIDIPEHFYHEINLTQENAPPLESPDDPNLLPRLEKIFSEAIRILNGEEEEIVQTGAKKGGAAPKQPPKKEEKKQPGGKKGKEEVEEKKEETENEIELKKAISVEKNIFRNRLLIIKNMAKKRMIELRQKANLLYSRLEDWINYDIKVETTALTELSKIFRKAIEYEHKLQEEIQLNYVDIFISSKTLNFLTPPPVILPAREIAKKDRFSISQLFSIIEELKFIASDRFVLDSRDVLLFFLNKSSNNISLNDIPKNWVDKNLADYQKFIKSLDPQSNGTIDGRQLCTYLCLLKSPIPDMAEISKYNSELLKVSRGGFIQRSEFSHVKCWFDTTEKAEREPGANHFERNKHIKELIFYINQEPGSTNLNIENYLKILTPKKEETSSRNIIRTYEDFLFG